MQVCVVVRLWIFGGWKMNFCLDFIILAFGTVYGTLWFGLWKCVGEHFRKECSVRGFLEVLMLDKSHTRNLKPQLQLKMKQHVSHKWLTEYNAAFGLGNQKQSRVTDHSSAYLVHSTYTHMRADQITLHLEWHHSISLYYHASNHIMSNYIILHHTGPLMSVTALRKHAIHHQETLHRDDKVSNLPVWT